MNFDPSKLDGLRPRKGGGGGGGGGGRTGFKIDMDFNGPVSSSASSSHPAVAPLDPKPEPAGYAGVPRGMQNVISNPSGPTGGPGTGYTREDDGALAPPSTVPRQGSGAFGGGGGGGGFDMAAMSGVMGGALASLPAGQPRATPAARRPNAAQPGAAMNFNDFNAYPGRRDGGGGAMGGDTASAAFMLDEDVELAPSYAAEDPSWGAKPPSFASKTAAAPASKGANPFTLLMLALLLCIGGLVTFREEVFAFGVSFKDIGRVPDIEETEQAQVELAMNGESEVPKTADDVEGATGTTMREAVEAGSVAEDEATDEPGAETPTAEIPAAEIPAAEEPAVEEPAVEEPAEEAPAGAGCEDTSQYCAAWKHDGQCVSNPRFMAKSCAKTCDLCEGSAGHVKLYGAAEASPEVLVERPKTSTLWGMMTGKTADHLGRSEKLRSKLQRHAPMQKLGSDKDNAKTKKKEDEKKDEKNKKDKEKERKGKTGGEKQKPAKAEKKRGESSMSIAARLYEEVGV